MKTELCGKHIDTLREWRVTCGLPKDHEGYCVTIAIGGGGAIKGAGFDGRGPTWFDASDGPDIAQTVAIWDTQLAGHWAPTGHDVFVSVTQNVITPRDAFEAGFRAGRWCKAEAKAAVTTERELAWEHFQAERMKAATEPESCG